MEAGEDGKAMVEVDCRDATVSEVQYSPARLVGDPAVTGTWLRYRHCSFVISKQMV